MKYIFTLLFLILLFVPVQAQVTNLPNASPRGGKEKTKNIASPLEIPNKIEIIQQPNDQIVCLGQPALFRVGIGGSVKSKVRFQWEVSSDKGKNWSDIPNADEPTYSGLSAPTFAHNGAQIRVRLATNEESIWSKPATLYVENKITFNSQPRPQSVTEGGKAVFEARVDNYNNVPRLYQWQQSPYGTATWFDIPGQTFETYEIPEVDLSISGNLYRLLVKSLSGCDSATSAPVALAVLATPVVMVTPGSRTYCGGGTATFSVKLRGGSGQEKIQWQFSKNEGKTFQDIKNATELFYMLHNITPEMTGQQYRAKITLPGNIVLHTLPAVLTIQGAVSFSQQPSDQSVCTGGIATYKVKTELNNKKPEYQWQTSIDGETYTDLEGETQETLQLNSTNHPNGSYIRALINVGGCQTLLSKVVRLWILEAPEIAKHPEEVTINLPDDDAIFTATVNDPSNVYSTTWQWSGNDGSSWQTMPGGKGTVLRLERPNPSLDNNLYRLKILNKSCGNIYYSNAARLVFKK